MPMLSTEPLEQERPVHLTDALVIIAPPSVLQDLPRDRLADCGYFAAGVTGVRQAIKAASVFKLNQIVIDERVADDLTDVWEGLTASHWTRNVPIHICPDCTSWHQLRRLLSIAIP